jgi:hypothetical protein
MDEERNRQDVGSTESPTAGRADDPFARWSAARARVRNQGPLHARAGDGAVAPPTPPGMEDLRGELERERRLRVSLEAALRDITTLLEEERDRRRVAEERADAVIAELELASRAHSVDPQRRRRRGVRRVVRRISGRR